LAILKNGIQIDHLEQEKFALSWQKSFENAIKLISSIENLKPLKMDELVLVNEKKDIQFDMAKKVSQHLSKLTLKFSSESLTSNKNYLKNLVSKIISVSAEISLIVCNQSISVYNDQLEAYLYELMTNEIDKRSANINYNSLAKYFNDLLNYYKQKKSDLLKINNFANKDINGLISALNNLLEMKC
jgi:hypothetical protein